MSLFFNTDDGVHLERVNATQMAKRGIFVNVKSANKNRDEGDFGYETPSNFFQLENNLHISPSRRRDAFTKATIKKVCFTPYLCLIIVDVHIAIDNNNNTSSKFLSSIFLLLV